MKLTPNPSVADSLFLYYQLSSPSMRAERLNQGIGSSVPGFNLGQLRGFRVTLPPLPEQRAIARILGTLDDKIELNRQMNWAVETAQVIEELIALAKEMRADRERGEELGLTEEELAFYDALEVNGSAVRVLGDDQLKAKARDLAETVRRNATIDWTVRENVRANLRRMVRRVLRKHGYPPDKQEQATQTVVQQAELMGREWVAA